MCVIYKIFHSYLFIVVDRAFGKKNVEYIKFEKDFVVSGWPEGIAFKQPNDYGKNQVKVIMESKDNIEFSAIERVNVASNEGQRATLNAQSSENDSNRTATINEAETLNDGITKKRKFRGKTNSFVKKGDIIPCLTEEGTYWLFKCLSKVKTNGIIKGRWFDLLEEPRHFVLLKEVVQINEKVVITKDNKRMVLPNSYFDEVTDSSCIISTAAHNIITDHLLELQRTVQ